MHHYYLQHAATDNLSFICGWRLYRTPEVLIKKSPRLPTVELSHLQMIGQRKKPVVG